MRILVTGGAGFIGSHVVERYLAAGHEVHVLDNLSTGHVENVPAGAIFHRLDLRDPATADLLRRERFEVINHHAAQPNVSLSVQDPFRDAEVNVMGLLALLQAASDAGTRRVIFAGSGGAVSGEVPGEPADEEVRSRPLSPYAVAKFAGELYLQVIGELRGMETVVLRYANVYGPRQDSQGEAGVVAVFISEMMAGRVPPIFGDGGQCRDFVFVRDIARANFLALSGDTGQVFNLSTAVTTTVSDLYDRIARRVGFSEPPRFEPARRGEIRRSVLSNERARAVLGFFPDISIDEGLAETVEWFRTGKPRPGR